MSNFSSIKTESLLEEEDLFNTPTSVSQPSLDIFDTPDLLKKEIKKETKKENEINPMYTPQVDEIQQLQFLSNDQIPQYNSGYFQPYTQVIPQQFLMGGNYLFNPTFTNFDQQQQFTQQAYLQKNNFVPVSYSNVQTTLPTNINPSTSITVNQTIEEDEKKGTKKRKRKNEKVKKEIEKKKEWKRKKVEREKELERLVKKPEKFNTQEEEEEWKRKKRMVRNRLSAQASRERKRKEMDLLKDENQELKDQIAVLVAENKQLKNENVLLKQKLEEKDDTLDYLNNDNVNNTKSSLTKKSFTLFAFLLSFGLFFGSLNFLNMGSNSMVLSKTNSIGKRVLLSYDGEGKCINHPVNTETKSLPEGVPKNLLKWKKDEILFPSVMKNHIFNNSDDTQKSLPLIDQSSMGFTEIKKVNKLLNYKEGLNSKKIKALEKAILIHKVNEDKKSNTVYFFSPHMFPLFKNNQEDRKDINITFLFPVEAKLEQMEDGVKTLLKVKKITAVQYTQSDAFLTI